jgi:ribosomal-protein-alanine N-acetyltransferase
VLPLSTARLTFRAWRDDDLPTAQQIWGDPRVTALVGGPFDDAAVRDRLAVELAHQRDHGIAYWPMSLTATGALAGCCGLRPRAPGIHELGFYLVPACWGGGLAAEAARAVVAHAFDTLRVVALFAGHHPDNHASRRTLEAIGFAPTTPELYPPTGLVHPGYELRAQPSGSSAT